MGLPPGGRGAQVGLFNTTNQFKGIQLSPTENFAESFSGIELGLGNNFDFLFTQPFGRNPEEVDPKKTYVAGSWKGVVVNGMQVGLMNNGGQMRGVQLGLTNTSQTLTGFRLGGFNYSGSSKGLEVGVANVRTESDVVGGSGVMLGVANISGGDFHGLQVGVVNISQHIKGLQLGIINIVASRNDHGPKVMPLANFSF